jgi:hypothetical protein
MRDVLISCDVLFCLWDVVSLWWHFIMTVGWLHELAVDWIVASCTVRA